MFTFHFHVVHPAPGNATGTLVNGILQHWSLPAGAFSYQEVISDDEGLCSSIGETSVRPGIVHRLDKGTSGLLVVAKVNFPKKKKTVVYFWLPLLLAKIELVNRLTCSVGRSHAHLSEQFHLNTIQRIYISLTSGVPSVTSGRVEVPIGRDPNNRIRMTAITGSSKHGQARHAASRWFMVLHLFLISLLVTFV